MQDVSYTKNESYAALMDGWLAAATPIDKVTQDIKAYCAVDAPADKDTSDLYVPFKDVPDFQRIARLLWPMQGDPRVCDLGGRASAHMACRFHALGPSRAVKAMSLVAERACLSCFDESSFRSGPQAC